MKAIKQYIIEKFKISKDIKENLPPIVNKILSIVSCENNNEIKNIVFTWVEDNKVSKIVPQLLFTLESYKYSRKLKEKGIDIEQIPINKVQQYIKDYFHIKDYLADDEYEKAWEEIKLYKDKNISIYGTKEGLYFNTLDSKEDRFIIIIINNEYINH